MCELGYMNFPGIYLRNGVEKINGEDFDDITDWGGTFIEEARKALLKLYSGKQGRGKILLDAVCDILKKGQQKITIEPTPVFGGQGGSGWDEQDFVIRWCTSPQTNTSDNWDQLNGIPPFIILGHELVHALHTLTKSTNYGEGRLNNNAIEEARTVGLGPWKDEVLSENGLRAEWDLPPRTTFQGVGADKLLKGTKYAGL